MRRSFVPVVVAVLLAVTPAAADDPKSPVLTPEEQTRADEAVRLVADAVSLYQQGRATAAIAKLERTLEIRRTIYSALRYPAGHMALVECVSNLGVLWQAAGDLDRARPYLEQTLAALSALYPTEKHPAGHPYLAVTLNNLGMLCQATGDQGQARQYLERALHMNRALFPKEKHPAGHPGLAQSINNMGFALQAAGDLEQARPYLEQALAMRRALYPKETQPAGHPELAESLNNLGAMCQAAGDLARARTYHEQALAMYRALFPKEKYPAGHRFMAMSLNNLSTLWAAADQLTQARETADEALAMRRALYPKEKYPAGHPDLAQSLNNVAAVWQDTGDLVRARDHYEQALAMNWALYPKEKYPAGHPDLATALNNLGRAWRLGGDLERARSHYVQAFEMRRALYPPERYPAGHPHLLSSLDNLASVARDAGDPGQARTYFEQAVAMDRALADRHLATSSEGDALAFLAIRHKVRDAYLSLPDAAAVADSAAYAAVWRDRSVVTRLLEQRHAAARAAGTEHAPKLARLRDNRRQTEVLLQNTRVAAADRDRRLATLAGERDTLERELVAAIPVLKRRSDLDRLGPSDLGDGLPPGAAFVDLVAYTRKEYDRATAAEKRSPGYVAFVLPAGGHVTRVELGAARPIDAAVAAWRTAIDARADDRAAAGRVRDLVWSKVAAHLRTDTTTIYLAPDGDLARVPWAALPTAPGRVLLEDAAVAVVPHGPYLLEHLRNPAVPGKGPLLVLGDVDYGSSAWPELPGTKAEVAATAALAPAARETLTRADATAGKLADRLPAARYAHLATHGEFRAAEYRAEQQRHLVADRLRRENPGPRPAGGKNPLGYVGLALAGGEVLSGLSILDLPLENVQLITLSACETGLGEYSGGKGVENLALAFHLAGCPNVVASLWKVNDTATAALMAKFYHELWVHKKPPIEALREAQLTIYRRPDLIPDLAGVRGAPRLKDAVAVKSVDTAPAAARRSDTKLWAAFVLSGVGR